jgi:hypothetical protein
LERILPSTRLSYLIASVKTLSGGNGRNYGKNGSDYRRRPKQKRFGWPSYDTAIDALTLLAVGKD